MKESLKKKIYKIETGRVNVHTACAFLGWRSYANIGARLLAIRVLSFYGQSVG